MSNNRFPERDFELPEDSEEGLDLLTEIDNDTMVEYKGFVIYYSDGVYQIYECDDFDTFDPDDAYPDYDCDTLEDAKDMIDKMSSDYSYKSYGTDDDEGDELTLKEPKPYEPEYDDDYDVELLLEIEDEFKKYVDYKNFIINPEDSQYKVYTKEEWRYGANARESVYTADSMLDAESWVDDYLGIYEEETKIQDGKYKYQDISKKFEN